MLIELLCLDFFLHKCFIATLFYNKVEFSSKNCPSAAVLYHIMEFRGVICRKTLCWWNLWRLGITIYKHIHPEELEPTETMSCFRPEKKKITATRPTSLVPPFMSWTCLCFTVVTENYRVIINVEMVGTNSLLSNFQRIPCFRGALYRCQGWWVLIVLCLSILLSFCK